MSTRAPLPANEIDRILNLSEYNLDYSSFENNFKDLAKLAAKVAGTRISLVNLIDTYTQWTVSNYGLEVEHMPREESVCQYTIAMPGDHFEVPDLSKDPRFKDKSYVVDDPALRYYYGIPLQSDGYNIGALCVLDQTEHSLSPEKLEMLKIIGEEIVNRLRAYKVIESLRNKVTEVTTTQNKVVHDIRGPLGGIIGLAQIIAEQGNQNKMDEVLEFINLIQKSGNSILELADEILSSAKKQDKLSGGELNLKTFKEKLEKLYVPQSRTKGVSFRVTTNPDMAEVAFSKNKLLQITGNLVSNAIKFTAAGGEVAVDLDLESIGNANKLTIGVTDSGVGLDQDQISRILTGSMTSSNGTGGEEGYGFGLALVKHLVDGMKGKFSITSAPGQGARFLVELVIPAN